MTSRSSASTCLPSRAKNLQIEWTSHLKDEQAKKKFEEHVRNSRQGPAWDRLIAILEKRLASNSNARHGHKDFDKASWPYQQAYYNGLEDGLLAVLDLIKFEKE